MATDLGSLDLLGEVTGVGSYPKILADAIDVQFSGRTLKLMSIATLKQAMRGAGRIKDLLDLEALDKLSRS